MRVMKDFAAVIVALVVVLGLLIVVSVCYRSGAHLFALMAFVAAVVSLDFAICEYRDAKELRHRRTQRPPLTTAAGFPEQSRRDIR